MSKVFKRPMFRKGGNVGNGIMTGIRDNFENGTPSPSERINKALEEYNTPAIDPIYQLLIQGGLRGMSETGGGSTLGNLAKAFVEPTDNLFKSLQARKNTSREVALAGVTADIDADLQQQKIDTEAQLAQDKLAFQAAEGNLDRQNAINVKIQAGKNKLAELQFKVDNPEASTNMQKDYSPQRAYEDFVADRTKQAGELPFGRKPNLEQKYPRASSEYDTYILRNLRSSQNEIANDIKQNNGGFVPFDPKKKENGGLVYEQMIPGIYYFDPRRKVFVQNIPESEENGEGGFYSVNPYTFQKNKIIPK
tara:strand:- start:20 stop:940 length:921 start_codon:yes stop_codon:yes gene_type:complete